MIRIFLAWNINLHIYPRQVFSVTKMEGFCWQVVRERGGVVYNCWSQSTKSVAERPFKGANKAGPPQLEPLALLLERETLDSKAKLVFFILKKTNQKKKTRLLGTHRRHHLSVMEMLMPKFSSWTMVSFPASNISEQNLCCFSTQQPMSCLSQFDVLTIWHFCFQSSTIKLNRLCSIHKLHKRGTATLKVSPTPTTFIFHT